jgi:hypothetical protein
MLIAFHVVAVIRAFMKATRAFNNISGLDLRLTSREVRKKNLFCLAVLASETEIPLSRGKRTHALRSSITSMGDEERGLSDCSYIGDWFPAVKKNWSYVVS